MPGGKNPKSNNPDESEKVSAPVVQSDPSSPNPGTSTEPANAPLSYGLSSVSISTQQTEIYHSIPYVSAEELKAYHKISPDIAKIIIEHNLSAIDLVRAEEAVENAHRRSLETQDQKDEAADRAAGRQIEQRGQLWAGIVALGGFAVCGLALYLNQPTAAIWLGCTMIVSLVGVFIAGRALGNSNQPVAPDAIGKLVNQADTEK
jgi:hypothetical protein